MWPPPDLAPPPPPPACPPPPPLKPPPPNPPPPPPWPAAHPALARAIEVMPTRLSNFNFFMFQDHDSSVSRPLRASGILWCYVRIDARSLVRDRVPTRSHAASSSCTIHRLPNRCRSSSQSRRVVGSLVPPTTVSPSKLAYLRDLNCRALGSNRDHSKEAVCITVRARCKEELVVRTVGREGIMAKLQCPHIVHLPAEPQTFDMPV